MNLPLRASRSLQELNMKLVTPTPLTSSEVYAQTRIQFHARIHARHLSPSRQLSIRLPHPQCNPSNNREAARFLNPLSTPAYCRQIPIIPRTTPLPDACCSSSLIAPRRHPQHLHVARLTMPEQNRPRKFDETVAPNRELEWFHPRSRS